MSPPSTRVLSEPVRAYRIGDPKGIFPIYSARGSVRTEGRWHEKGQEVIYASRYYSTAMLEKLAHYNSILPSNQHYIEIDMPVGISYETVTAQVLPGWIDKKKARAYGSRWYQEQRSAVLIMPSYVAQIEENVLINCAHSEFARIRVGLEYPVFWDGRLFAKPQS